MTCPTGFVEITINSGWCVETTTDADIIRILSLVLAVVVIIYISYQRK